MLPAYARLCNKVVCICRAFAPNMHALTEDALRFQKPGNDVFAQSCASTAVASMPCWVGSLLPAACNVLVNPGYILLEVIDDLLGQTCGSRQHMRLITGTSTYLLLSH